MAEPTKWARDFAFRVAMLMFPGGWTQEWATERLPLLALALDEARRRGIARLADPDNGLIWRGVSVAAATGAVLTDVQMHDICQALADELEPTDD